MGAPLEYHQRRTKTVVHAPFRGRVERASEKRPLLVDKETNPSVLGLVFLNKALPFHRAYVAHDTFLEICPWVASRSNREMLQDAGRNGLQRAGVIRAGTEHCRDSGLDCRGREILRALLTPP
jgi:hypothetical protein